MTRGSAAEKENGSESLAIYYHALAPSHVLIYRLVRLRALSECPSQFCSNFAQELAFKTEIWLSWLENSNSVTFIATSQTLLGHQDALDSENWSHPTQFEASDRFHYGLISCLQYSEEDALLAGLWVSPFARRYGIAQALIEKVITWAREYDGKRNKFKSVILHVYRDNLLARRLYERCGFVDVCTTSNGPEELRYVYFL
ncbi:hypothetical protein M408DRAFT_97383 [Serendipita vermifera MAFF 305830]|uniref:N-acetyltransferase domain-containing protein n=1 Tax=Serendipita vermifera MAFF 305830 TaxID=933852 RepID=A0A0C2X905_SERVB|nr:hypothetical protein M408DRAFT_97383 [Serendipita vermifera MAFF 305830]